MKIGPKKPISKKIEGKATAPERKKPPGEHYHVLEPEFGYTLMDITSLPATPERIGGIDPERLEKVKDEIYAGVPVYPIEVRHDPDSAPYIINGFHRLEASREIGFSKIPVIIQSEPRHEPPAPKKNVGPYVPPHLRKKV